MKSSWRRRYLSIPYELTSRKHDRTSFKLGNQKIKVVNDGGLGIIYNTGQMDVEWQSGGGWPVLSIEVPALIPSRLISRPNDGN